MDVTHGRIDRQQVFNDFNELFAIHISNAVDPVHLHTRLARAKDIEKQYTEREIDEMLQYRQMFATMYAKSHKMGKYQNLMAHLSETNGLTRKGQDQTPVCLAELTAALTLLDMDESKIRQHIDETGFITVADDSAGTGGMLIAAAEQIDKMKINYFRHMVARAIEIDSRMVHQCYIQLSMYAIPAVVIHGNTLTLDERDRWYTPAYIWGNWIWKSPMPISAGRNANDELLKMATDPMYAAMRKMDALFHNTPQKKPK